MCAMRSAEKKTKQKNLNGKNLDNEQIKGAKTFALTQSSTLREKNVYCVTCCAKNGHLKFMGLTEAIKNVVLCIIHITSHHIHQ